MNTSLIVAAAVCLGIAAVAWFMTRSTYRDATADGLNVMLGFGESGLQARSIGCTTRWAIPS